MRFRSIAIVVGGVVVAAGAAALAMSRPPPVPTHLPGGYVGVSVGASCDDVETYVLTVGVTSEEPSVPPTKIVWQTDAAIHDISTIRTNADADFADLWIEPCGLLTVGTTGDPSITFGRLRQLIGDRPFRVVGVEYSLAELQQIRDHIEERFSGPFSGGHLLQIGIDPVNNRVEAVFDEVAVFPGDEYPLGSVHAIEGTAFEE
jgi:hypothetical protein